MGTDSSAQPLLGDIGQPVSFLTTTGRIQETTLQQKIVAILWIIIGIPILCCAIPISVANFYYQKFTTPPPAKIDHAVQFPVFTADKKVDYAARKYDVVMFGATGFTGSLAVDYLIQQYGIGKFKWAIAGRNKANLEKVLKEHITTRITDESKQKDFFNNIDIIIADSHNVEQLRSMVNSTRSILTTAGPYEKYGTILVALCAAYGTHVADITGESDWVRTMIDNYEVQAKASGAIITSMAGHDCIPWDLTVLNAVQMMKTKYNKEVSHIDVYDRVSGAISGGTLSTILNSLIGREKYKAKIGFDPLVSLHGAKQSTDFKVANQSLLGFDNYSQQWVGPFVMAQVMGNCIRRTAAIMGFSLPPGQTTYSEKFVYSSIWQGITNFLSLVSFGVGLYIPGVPQLLAKLLPPGTGPTPAQQEKGYLHISVVARSNDKSTPVIESYCFIPKDPGYYYTARMLVETALVPILNKDELSTLPLYNKSSQSMGGYWTPASGLGPLLQKRLENIGIQFKTSVKA